MAWTNVSPIENRYLRKVTTAAIQVITSTTHISDVITEDISNGMACILGIENVGTSITAVPLDLQISHDNVTWIKFVTVAADCGLGTAGIHIFSVPTLQVKAPYYRLVFNPNAIAVATPPTIKFHVCALIPNSAYSPYGV
jgi:hypothetical protein